MATSGTEVAPDQVQGEDPYRVTSDGIQEPPEGWRASLRYFGPGLILSASIVGSGELIATTTLGAQAGFAILWMVIFSTLVKVAVQVELARWTISTGEPALTGYNKVPPKFGRIGGSPLLLVQRETDEAVLLSARPQAVPRTRWRSIWKLALPYICLLISFNLLIWPSVCPLL